jgi:predicted metalloendopeptidase
MPGPASYDPNLAEPTDPSLLNLERIHRRALDDYSLASEKVKALEAELAVLRRQLADHKELKADAARRLEHAQGEMLSRRKSLDLVKPR